MRKFKILSSVLACLVIMSTMFSLVVSAAVVEIDGIKKFENDDGTYATSQFVTYNKKTYYFDNNGNMVTGWLELSGDKYYFDENGIMQTGLRKIDGTYYYFSSKGKMCSGKIKVKNNVYVFGKDGKFKNKYNGWITFSDKTYYCVKGTITKGLKQISDEDGKSNLYYFDSDGKLIKDAKVNYKTDILYINSSGVVYKTVDNSDKIISKLEDLYDKENDYESMIDYAKKLLSEAQLELQSTESKLKKAQQDLASAKNKRTKAVVGSNGSITYKADTTTEQYYVDYYQKLVNEQRKAINDAKSTISGWEKELKKIKEEIRELEDLFN